MAYITNNYPTSIQTAIDPIGSDKVATFDHAGLETFQNDSVDALKAKVGINSSAVTTSHDYKLQNVTGVDKASSVAGTETFTNKTLTAPKIVNNGFIADANGNEQIEMVTVASAVNNVRVTNASTGNAPIIDSNGSDANIDLNIKGKGTGKVRLGTAGLKFPNADGAADQLMKTDGAGNLSFGAPTSDSSITLVAGEALTAGDAVMVASGNEAALLSATSTTNTVRETQTFVYQSFITGANTNSIKSIIALVDTNGGSGSASMTLRATASGANLFTAVDTGTINMNGEYEFVIPGGQAVSASTTYYIILQGNFRGGTTSSYGSGVSAYSSDSGATWTVPAPIVTGDFYFKVFEGYTTAGRVYKTSANSGTYKSATSAWTNNFIGFATTTVASAANIVVRIIGNMTGLTGLTTGITYFLSNTVGVISTTAGTVSKKVGLSTSTTSLLIKHDN